MITSSGIQKGLKTWLEERGVNTNGLQKEDMIKMFEEMRDFKL